KSSLVMQSILETAVSTADIILLQEPFINFTSDASISHPSFNLIIPPRLNNQPIRTLCFYTKHIPSLEVAAQTDLSPDPDLQVLSVSSALLPSFYIFVMYLDCSLSPDITSLIRILSPYIFTLHPRTIITGDFNAHHPWWNSSRPPRNADSVIAVTKR